MGCCSSKSQIPDPPFQNQSAPEPKKDASTQTKQEPLPQAQQPQPEPLYISPSCQSLMNIFREEEPFQPSGPLPSDHRTWINDPNMPYISSHVGYGADRRNPLQSPEQHWTDSMPSSGTPLLLKRKITVGLEVCPSFQPTSGAKTGHSVQKSQCLTGKLCKLWKFLSEMFLMFCQKIYFRNWFSCFLLRDHIEFEGKID